MAMAIAIAIAILLFLASTSSASASAFSSETYQILSSDLSSISKESCENDELHEFQQRLLSLEKTVSERNFYAIQKDKEILSLQKEIQQLEESNKERLINHRRKIAKEQAMAEELEEILARKSGEIDDLKRRIYVLENTQEQQLFEVKQLEQTSENQRTSMAEFQNVLHVTEESVLKLQLYLKLKTEELDKTHKQWLSPLAIKHYTLFIQKIEYLWIYALKKGKHGTVVVSNFTEVLKNEGVKHFKTGKELALTHLGEGQSTLKNKLEIVIEMSRPYMDALVRFVWLYVDGYEDYFEYVPTKMTSLYGEVLKSTIIYHHKVLSQPLEGFQS